MLGGIMAAMKRREALKRIGTAAAAIPAAFMATGSAAKADGKRPNIIFLLSDDQRWDALGCMGNPIIKTPSIDRLASNGTLFRNSYVTTPICCTSRASFLTGQYACRHGIDDFFTDFTPEVLNTTYPMIMRDNGYYTGFVGKYGVGNKPETMPEDRFDAWYGFPGWGTYEQTDEDGNYRHLTRIMGDQCLDFLENAPDDKPFNLSVSFKAPHVQDEDERQFIPDPAYDDLYADIDIPVAETADDKYFKAMPEFLRTSEARVRWKMRFPTPEKHQRSVKNYYRLITGIDVVVGDMMKKLDELGIADNTVIVYMSDNGFYLGEHGFAGKWFGHEESIRVPLIIHDPRTAKCYQGRELDEMALNIDIAPTILSLAGINVPDTMQGKNLMPLVQGDSVDWRHDFLFEHHFDSHPLIAKSEGVVGEQYKYLKYYELNPSYEELYDTVNDPLEKNNLAHDLRYMDVITRLRARLTELKADYR